MIAWAIVLLVAAGALAGAATRVWAPAPILPLAAVVALAPFLFVPFVLGPLLGGFVAGFAFRSAPTQPVERRQGVLMSVLSLLVFVLAVMPAFGSLGS